jgi:ankyrin repeat protein
MQEEQRLADAAMAGDGDAVRGILQRDATLASAYSEDGWTMLHLAATPEIAVLLLDAGADIDAPNRHEVFGPCNRPLHAAVYQARLGVVETLLARGADVNATDRAGWTPLHLAVAGGRVELARILLEHGADPNARIGTVNGQSWSDKTALELLAVPNRTGEGEANIPPEVDAEMRRLLVEAGASS